MKKQLNLIITTVAIVFGLTFATSANAQGLKNPSFEDGTTGWTVSGLVPQTNSSFTSKHGATYLEKWVGKGSAVGSASVKQVVDDLMPGKYTLTVAAQNLDQNDLAKKCTGAKIYAGSKSTTVYTTNDYTVEFTYFSGDLEIGYQATNATGNWLAVDNFRLERIGAPSAAETKTALTTLIASAEKLYGDGSGIGAAEFLNVIDDAKAVLANNAVSDDDALEAYVALQQGMQTYNINNVSEENPINVTKYIANPSFESSTTGWTVSGLVTQTNTSFTKKNGNTYLEKWVGKGSAVGNGSVSQVIKNLPNGVYKLTVAAQNLDQNNTTRKCDGAYIYANDVKTTVYTTNDYSVTFTSIAGEAEIGFKGENAMGNWLAVDNFRLYLVGKVDTKAIVEEIQRIVTIAEELTGKMMNGKVLAALNSAIEAGKNITESSSDADIRNAKNALDEAIEAAQQSVAEYEALAEELESVRKSYDETKNGAADFLAEIQKAEALVKNAEATSEELSNEINALETAKLAFLIANATPGTGTAVKITYTNHDVPTGATEALMRAGSVGSNVLERGVCWSTEHNPTVLDARTTKMFNNNGYIFHVKGLKPATVYYLRPYIMNKTYEVAYGDEVKIVTHPKGNCVGTWDEGAPDEAANTRCRNAIRETIEYFNQWTGIKGFTLSGHYGAGTATADCSYGGWMRIGPNAGNQAIGTVIHETGHGVGVGTSSRWSDTNVHSWTWFGREANDLLHFLENKYNDENVVMVGDGVHGWGANASYDWFVNGADKDTHTELQYIGGCVLLYGLFIDGLCPTNGYTNGIPGYTYNFDADKKYYIMCKDADHGLGDGLLYWRTNFSVCWKSMIGSEEISDDAAWKLEYNPMTGYYSFQNVSSGRYLTHAANGSNMSFKSTTSPSLTEWFQLMPDRTDVTIGTGESAFTTHGYWFTWNDSGNKSMQAGDLNQSNGYGVAQIKSFNYASNASTQHWIIISEDELSKYREAYLASGIQSVDADKLGSDTPAAIYSAAGVRTNEYQKGVNIVKMVDGTTRKIYRY